MAVQTHHDPVRHPILRASDQIADALSGVADVQPLYMNLSDKAAALLELQRCADRVEELRLRVLAASGDLAADRGCRDQAQWLAHHAGRTPEKARADLRLARALERHQLAGAGLRDGRISLDQTVAVVRALALLPAEVPADTLERCEAALVGQAPPLTPKQIALVGLRVLELVAPDEADAIEGRRLEQQEREARAKVKLSMKRLGHGLTRISAVVSDSAADRLVTYLDAFTNPRRDPATDMIAPVAAPHPFQRLPYPHRAGLAFEQLLECFDPDRMPVHGGDATTLMVTISLEALRAELGTAELLSHAPRSESEDRISASEARRLACNANLVPVVLGGKSEVLDLGRTRRLYSRAQRKALVLRDRTCRAEGCDFPADWCEAHHLTPWSRGGRTDLRDAVLFCSHHHHLIHHPGYRHERLASGAIRFHRRP